MCKYVSDCVMLRFNGSFEFSFYFRLWEIQGAAYTKSFDLNLIQVDVDGNSKVLLSLNWIQHENKLKVRVPTNNELCLAQTILCVQEHAHC